MLKGINNLSIKNKILFFLTPSFLITIIIFVFVFTQFQNLINYQKELEDINKIENEIYHTGWKVYELSSHQIKYIDIRVTDISKKIMDDIYQEINTTLNEVNQKIQHNKFQKLVLTQDINDKIKDFIQTNTMLLDRVETAHNAVIDKELKNGKDSIAFFSKDYIDWNNNYVSVMISRGLEITNFYKESIDQKISDLTKEFSYLIIIAGALIILISFFAV